MCNCVTIMCVIFMPTNIKFGLRKYDLASTKCSGICNIYMFGVMITACTMFDILK